jgi:hypothetical protein
MNIALNVDSTSKSLQDLDLEEEKDFSSRLRASCGLFIYIHHDKIYFLHQTAREFLLADSTSAEAFDSEPRWQHSITYQGAHNILAETCVLYLDFFGNYITRTDAREESRQALDNYTSLDYSAKYWGPHCLRAYIDSNSHIVPSILRICSPHSKSWGK